MSWLRGGAPAGVIHTLNRCLLSNSTPTVCTSLSPGSPHILWNDLCTWKQFTSLERKNREKAATTLHVHLWKTNISDSRRLGLSKVKAVKSGAPLGTTSYHRIPRNICVSHPKIPAAYEGIFKSSWNKEWKVSLFWCKTLWIPCIRGLFKKFVKTYAWISIFFASK